MANNVPFQSSSPSTPSSATTVETIDQGAGVQRQVVQIGSFATAIAVSSGTVTLSSNPTVIPSSNVNVVIVGVPTVMLSSNPTVIQTQSNTGAVTSIAGTSSGSTVLSSNAVRTGAAAFNEASITGYLRLSSTANIASSAAYTVQVGPNSYYEFPFNYLGASTISFSSAPASGALRVTEFSS